MFAADRIAGGLQDGHRLGAAGSRGLEVCDTYGVLSALACIGHGVGVNFEASSNCWRSW